MKKRHTIVSLLLCLFVAACYDKDIDGLNGRVDDIENNKIRGDLGISYDSDVLRLMDAFSSVETIMLTVSLS